MKTFRDNAGRVWTVSITVYAVKRVRAFLNLDLYGLIDEKFEGLSKLLADPVSLVDVLYVLCRDEADKLGISDEDFGRAMAGDAIESATEAFIGELIDFFPDARTREALRKVIEASKRVRGILFERVNKELEAIDHENVVRTLLSSSGTLQESSGSIPDHLPSENSLTWLKDDLEPYGVTRQPS